MGMPSCVCQWNELIRRSIALEVVGVFFFPSANFELDSLAGQSSAYRSGPTDPVRHLSVPGAS